MKGLENFKYVKGNNSDVLVVLLHGSGVGMDSQFMTKLWEAYKQKGYGVATFNFPFFDRGDDHSSGPELKEEIETLKNVLKHCHANKYEKVILVGKSLGGIIASFYLKTLGEEEQRKYEVVIFGYVTGSVDLSSFPGNITIIQGEKDKFGSISKVKEDLKDADSSNINFAEIPGADHSYRNPETKSPDYEDEAVNKYLELEEDN